MRAPSPRTRLLALLAAALLVPAATPEGGLDEAAAATEWGSPGAHLTGAPGCAAGTPGAGCRVLADPATPGDDDPAALAALGPSNSPEDDLAAVLQRLAGASDAAAAAAARDEALAILEGTPLPGRPYSGLPLLNWNAPAKVKVVPAGGTVEVREVRFPGHALSDAWLLEFEDPTQPYTVRYRVSELGGSAGGELAPVPLQADGDDRTGAVPSALVSLLPPELRTGTFVQSRFTNERGLAAGGQESTRVAEQVVEMRMPAPERTAAILQPSLRPDAPALFTLQPATAARRDAAAAAVGFAGADPTAAERTAAIERLAAAAPERQLWSDLRALPAGGDELVAAARLLGAQDAALVDAMRNRGELPAGTGADVEADLTLVLQNGETYVSRTRLRPAASGRLQVRVINRDGYAHPVSAFALHDRRAVLGADDWGEFAWTPLAGEEVAPGARELVTLDLPAEAFSLWLGDGETGDQAATMIALDHGPRVASIAPTEDMGALPLHQAIDAAGDHWLTLSGADALVRLSPAAELGLSARTVHLIPGGKHTATSPELPLEPSDVAVDHRGVVWSTLALGNGIARVDPALARDGTTAGVRVYALPACGDDECPPVFPPEPGARPTRQPLQMKVTQDAQGNSLVWFTEANADRIGLLRVAPDGTQLGQSHFSCGCGGPAGIALDQAGDVWFTESVTNRIGRLSLDPGRYAAAGARLRHYPIPSGILVEEPELSPLPVVTSVPHSVAVDRRGLVWFTESATARLGHLDPALAEPGTSAGIGEIDLPATDFGTAASPADLTIDRAGTVFWTDEYGDIVGSVRTDGPRAGWAPGRSFRPAARRSLTDSPLVDPAGDLWFLEAGANRITRVAGVSAGNPAVPARPDVDVDLTADTLAVSGLDEASALDVRVVRGGTEVARADGVAVAAGAARIDAWGAADALRPGDVLELRPQGDHLQAALATRLPSLTARTTASGVEGEAHLAGQPLAGSVVADDGRTAALAADTGAFALAGPAATVAWTAATPGAAWHVRVAVAAAPAPTPVPATPAPQPAPRPQAPAAPAPEAPQAEPRPEAEPVAEVPAVAPQPAPAPVVRPAKPACPAYWLAAGRPAFVGLAAAELRACLGAPRSRRDGTWRYARGLALRIEGGRAVAMTLDAPGWTSARGGLAVGAPARTVRGALPGARSAGRGVLRARLDGGVVVRVTVDSGRVQRIEVRA